MGRATHPKLGRETCERIAKVLERYAKVKIGKGRNGEPDMILEMGSQAFGVEAKRCKGIAFKRSVNNIELSKIQWEYLVGWCKENKARPIVAVEIVVVGGENIYFILDTNVVDEGYKRCEGKTWFGFSMWQVIRSGDKPDDYFWRAPV